MTKIPKLATKGWGKGPFGHKGDWADDGGFKKGKDWSYGPEPKDSHDKIGGGKEEEDREDKKETGYHTENFKKASMKILYRNNILRLEIVEYSEPVVFQEANYQDRTVKLNKPMAGDTKKFKVYVNSGKKNKDGTIKVKKVEFGQKGARIKKDNPDARRSFRARHKCDQKKDKTSAGYWSCKKW